MGGFNEIILKKIKRKLSAELPKTHTGLVKRAQSLKIRVTKNTKDGKVPKSDAELVRNIKSLKNNKDKMYKFIQFYVLKTLTKSNKFYPNQRVAISYKIADSIQKSYFKDKR